MINVEESGARVGLVTALGIAARVADRGIPRGMQKRIEK